LLVSAKFDIIADMKSQDHYILGNNRVALQLAHRLQQLHPHANITILIDTSLTSMHPVDLGTFASLTGSTSQLLSQLDSSRAITITIDTLSATQLAYIYEQLKNFGFQSICYLPTLDHLPLAEANALPISSEYFLGRPSMNFVLDDHLHYLNQKDILITGAGGSIGSELAAQLLHAKPKTIYLFGHGETSIYHVEKNLRLLQAAGEGIETIIRPIIGEMQDAPYMMHLLQKIKVHAIFHCAAHKHVPLMELNPIEAIKNNLFGLLHLLEAAKAHQLERFVLISTDKAVHPANIYGVSKSLSEEIVLMANREGYPFFVVRFGNVLGSRGSILPLFHEQVIRGGPITITDERMKRYWMTIPEATSLVLMAGGLANPEPLYLLDMGEPIKIFNIASQVAKLYGYTLGSEQMPVRYIGLRPGESLEEDLIGKTEKVSPTAYPQLLQVTRQSETFSPATLHQLLDHLRDVCFLNPSNPHAFRSYARLLTLLKEVFPELQSDASADWL
jgi:FlaA1/EpsC-like NDP-sugar epimerase